MRLGISSYAFGWAIGFDGVRPDQPMDAFGLLEAARSLNVEVVQIADNLPLDEMPSSSRRELKRIADESELAIEVGTRGLCAENVRTYAEIAREFESDIVRLVIDDKNHHPSLGEVTSALKQVEDEIQDCCIAIENHDRFRAAELRKLMETLDSANIGICLDTANSIGAGEGIETLMHELARYVVNLHVKDIQIRRTETLMGFDVSGCPAGRGQIDIPSLIARLPSRCESMILEQWTPRQSTLSDTVQLERSWAKQSLDYLKSLRPPEIKS